MQIIVEMKENLMAKVVYLGIKAWWHMLHTSYKILYYPQWIRLFFPSALLTQVKFWLWTLSQ